MHFRTPIPIRTEQQRATLETTNINEIGIHEIILSGLSMRQHAFYIVRAQLRDPEWKDNH